MTALSENELPRLTSLLEIVSPSMQEEDMISYLKSDWQSVVSEGKVKVDAIGNLEFSVIRSDDFPTVAIVAHADTISVQLTQRIGNGRYRFRSIGCSPHMLLGQNVVIVNECGQKFHGVVGFDATSQYGQPKGLVFEDLWIDVNHSRNSDDVTPGDLAVLAPQSRIEGDCITGTGLDDRLGLFVVGEVLRRYAQNDAQVNLICVATTQEEVGLRGSQTFEFTHKPDGVIVVDVDYATDIPTPHEDQMGRLYLGQGPGVLRKADNSSTLRGFIKRVAAKCDIPLQASMGRFLYGGTDCSSLQVTRNAMGYRVANITLPLRYMHSPIETASLSDVANAINLASTVVSAMTKNI